MLMEIIPISHKFVVKSESVIQKPTKSNRVRNHCYDLDARVHIHLSLVEASLAGLVNTVG